MAALVAAVPVAPVQARAGCVWSNLVRDEAGTAVITSSAARVQFVKDGALQRDGPSPAAACRAAASLTPGDVVLIGPMQDRYTCAGGAAAVRSVSAARRRSGRMVG